jgi:hypothetical protein
MRLALASALAALALSTACAELDEPGELDGDDAAALPLSSLEEAGLLAFANHQTTDVTRLDVDCALRSDAARNIIAHRDGADGVAGTGDDDRFDSVAELDAVPRVGPVTLRLLADCAAGHGFVGADFVVTAEEVGPLIADSMPSSYFNDVAGELCAAVAEDMPFCIGRCVDHVQIAAEEWYVDLLATWVGLRFPTRAAAIEAAQDAAFAAGEQMSEYWANPELAALNAVIGCAGG